MTDIADGLRSPLFPCMLEGDLLDLVNKQRADGADEIERLRAVLRDIACDCKHDCADSPLGLSPVTPNCCRNFARAALGEKE